jgi:hypothetical protein
MPAKKSQITDAERAKRIGETAKKIGVETSPKAFEEAFAKVIPAKAKTAKSR